MEHRAARLRNRRLENRGVHLEVHLSREGGEQRRVHVDRALAPAGAEGRGEDEKMVKFDDEPVEMELDAMLADGWEAFVELGREHEGRRCHGRAPW